MNQTGEEKTWEGVGETLLRAGSEQDQCQLALSSFTGHFFGCRRGAAKSSAIGDPFRNGLSLPETAAARQGQWLWFGAMGECLWFFSSSVVALTLHAKAKDRENPGIQGLLLVPTAVPNTQEKIQLQTWHIHHMNQQ